MNKQTQIVVAGAGYAGLHVAQRLGTWLGRHPEVGMTLVDQHPYHQLVTELPQVASGTRSAEAVRVPLETLLSRGVRFVQTAITGFDLAGRTLLTEAEPLPYSWLVLALGSRPNDFNIPGLAEWVLTPYSSEDAQRVWDAVTASVRKAADTSDPQEQERLMTVVIGGGGATGVELAGGFAEELPGLARQYGAPPEHGCVILLEAGHTILAGSSPGLIGRANQILQDLKVDVRTNAAIAEATAEGLHLKHGEVITGGVYIWAGGVKAPEIIQGSGVPIGYNGRIKVDQYLRALDHPEIFVAGDLASVVDPNTGRALPPLAQIAIEEGETVMRNLRASIEGTELEPFTFQNKGFVVSVGGRRGVADIAGLTIGGRLAHTLKDAIEWEYRQSVKYLRGWGAA
jgi:NADH dehydrogenase